MYCTQHKTTSQYWAGLPQWWALWSYRISQKFCVIHVPPVQYAQPPPSKASQNPAFKIVYCFHNSQSDMQIRFACQLTHRWHCTMYSKGSLGVGTWWGLVHSQGQHCHTCYFLSSHNFTMFLHHSLILSPPLIICLVIRLCYPLCKGYTWSSLTTDTPPFSSGRKVSFEHFLKRSKPIRISAQR